MIQTIPSASRAGSKPFYLATGQAIAPGEFKAKLLSLGYKVGTIKASAPGEACEDAGGLTVWPFGSAEPLAIYWLGANVESIARGAQEVQAVQIGSAPAPAPVASKPEAPPQEDDLFADLTEAERDRLARQQATLAGAPEDAKGTPILRDIPGADEQDAIALAAAFERREQADAEIETLKAKLLEPCEARVRQEILIRRKWTSCFKAFGVVVFRLTKNKIVLGTCEAVRFRWFMRREFKAEPESYSIPARSLALRASAAADPEIFNKIESLVGKENFSAWFSYQDGIQLNASFQEALFTSPYYKNNDRLKEELALAGVKATTTGALMLRIGRRPGAPATTSDNEGSETTP